jgi:hypothetical protein
MAGAAVRRGFAFVAAGVACIIALAQPAFAASPNPALTPGATDPVVTQSNVSSTICTRGYSSTVRNVSTQTKHGIYAAYGIPRSQQRNYVIDHLVPLEVGGANDPKNLWPEPKADAKVKDKLENQMHASVCNGGITLTLAQGMFTAYAWQSTAASATAVPATAPPTAAPATTPPPAQTPSQQIVHPGAFCAPAGATGVTTAGTMMVCGPASDGRNRWHSA